MDPKDKESQEVVPKEEEKTDDDDESENPNKSVDLEKSVKQDLPDNPIPPTLYRPYLPIKKRKTPTKVPKIEEAGPSGSKSEDPNLEKSLKRKLLSDPLPLQPLEISVIKTLKDLAVPQTKEAGPSTSTSTSTSSKASFWPKKDDNDVFKKIFAHLDSKTLHECRFTSSNANPFATAALLSKEHQLQFVDLKLQVEGYESEITLPELTQLLKTSIELNLGFPVKNFGFLYNVFESSEHILGNPEFQDFITHHGEHLEELSITYVESTPPCPKSTETVIMDQVRHLLIRQTPNLRVFEFGCPVTIAWKDKEFPQRINSSPLMQRDPEFSEIQLKTRAEERLNMNVKVFKFRELTLQSSKIVETIIEACPNLEAIFTGLVNPRKCCLLQPLNRLHLIKQMAIFNHSEQNMRGHIERWPEFIRRTIAPIQMVAIHWTFISDIDPELVRQLGDILKKMLVPGVEVNSQLLVRRGPNLP